jgi:hypothetical protein
MMATSCSISRNTQKLGTMKGVWAPDDNLAFEHAMQRMNRLHVPKWATAA